MKPVKYVLCCGGKKCPVLTTTEDEAILTDDFGGTVKLNEEQLVLLQNKLNEILG